MMRLFRYYKKPSVTSVYVTCVVRGTIRNHPQALYPPRPPIRALMPFTHQLGPY